MNHTHRDEQEIQVIGFDSFQDYQMHRGGSYSAERDTIAEARRLARRIVTLGPGPEESPGRICEYAQVLVDGDVVYDFFASPASMRASRASLPKPPSHRL
jgi:hypothetical protein